MDSGHARPIDIYVTDLDAAGTVNRSRCAVLLERALTAHPSAAKDLRTWRT
ncbi:hypothetical protein [Phytoactinopolyspora endophytica]|uniref:hypothetical protein n=1 Tax=Phytoactinopolyspora endophytica TaxID=1642495 RepID=UPI0013E9A966|nr:hypothetical protein [Phytoactinopolyspora endophytica]